MSLFSELRRRNVFKVGAAYLALSWIVIQITETLTPALNLPVSALPLVTWVGLIGFPFVLVFSWVYELTPEGLKRESDVDRGASVTQVTGRRLDYIIIAMLAIASLLFVFQYFGSSTGDSAAQPAVSESEPGAPAQNIASAPEMASTPQVDDKSIAVLPFADMSAEKDQEYMADGIAEELLNLLAKVPELKVIARTSSFAFKGEKVEIAEIAKRLYVAHVLEGSVRKSGNTVRITAQLIRASDSTHLWSERYDRPLDDIFAVQDEIASAIVQALQIHLIGDTVGWDQGYTENREAYELFLRARNGEDWNSRESLDAAARYLQRAIELDPNYSLAWSALGGVYAVKAELGYLDAKEGFDKGRQLVHRALELNPKSAEAHTELLHIYLVHDWDWAAAEEESQRALAIDPSNPGALNGTGRLSLTLGRWDDAERQFRAALVRDPLNEYVIYNLGVTYYSTRRFAEAEDATRELLAISPEFPWTRVLLSQTLLIQGKVDEALAVIQGERDDEMRAIALPMILWEARRRDEADRALRAQIEHWQDTGPSFIALSYAYRGEYELSAEWLNRAYEQKDPALIEVLRDPLFGNTLDDPWYRAFLRKMKLPEPKG